MGCRSISLLVHDETAGDGSSLPRLWYPIAYQDRDLVEGSLVSRLFATRRPIATERAVISRDAVGIADDLRA